MKLLPGWEPRAFQRFTC